MPNAIDGPSTKQFKPVSFRGNVSFSELAGCGISEKMAKTLVRAPSGRCVCWGIPFKVNRPLLLRDRPKTIKVAPLRAQWLIFMHNTDIKPPAVNKDGLGRSPRGVPLMGEKVADYVLVYADGTELRNAIRRGQQISMFHAPWGKNCSKALPHAKPHPIKSHGDQMIPIAHWARSQTRATIGGHGAWTNWIWAWENPHPSKAIVAIRFEPVGQTVLISAISAGKATSQPTRWMSRRKVMLTLGRSEQLDPNLDERGLLNQVQLDMGQVISVVPRPLYPGKDWPRTYNNRLPEISKREVLVEYTAHPDARFHLPGKRTVAVATLEGNTRSTPLRPIRSASQRVTIKVLDARTRKCVPVKLHVHGEAGEYLAPEDRHRYPNPFWFQDYSVEFTHGGIHHCQYIDGQTVIKLPLGRVYIEVSKGFEIRPIRKVVRVTRASEEIVLEIERVLPWRDRGWVTADTHVHFLSPQTALLEGAAEGVNIVNLLASQWGELMTNVGDFDGKTTFGSKQAGGDGEYMVRVGTENRQHILGHISLLGYNGAIIGPMTTGGPGESAIGDPVQVLLTEWAMQCKKQKGVVVIPHFPNPRLENAATITTRNAHAVEMTSWGNLYGGIDPYSLSDWYRYLNCGYLVAAVGGTDKMTATTAVGTIRTYAQIDKNSEFTYDTWKAAIRRGRTFATYGPLLEFTVDGNPPGSRIKMGSSGGTVDVAWKLASVTIPVSRLDLIVNGEVRESRSVNSEQDKGHWSVKIDRSSWIALLVRGHYADKPEIIAAHSSAVMIEVKGSPFCAPTDAVTILDQIEGALGYLDTIGTRAQTKRYKQMRLVLTSAHRKLHNRMHRMNRYHKHAPLEDHPEHH